MKKELPRTNPDDDKLARIVDKLLKKLPGADPHLRGSPTGSAPGGVARAGVAGGGGGIIQVTTHVPPPPPRQISLAQRIAVWVRVGLGVLAGVLIVQWPYARSCGFPLFIYIGAIGGVLAAACWAAMASWRRRLALAHVISLLLALWAIVLGAGQFLPRVGYAAERATWGCSAAPAVQ